MDFFLTTNKMDNFNIFQKQLSQAINFVDSLVIDMVVSDLRCLIEKK